MGQTLIKNKQIAGGLDGWIPAGETWTYASETTITVPSGAISRYRKGMPFKVTANSVELQGYIIGVADTLLTVAGDALTNHTFTDNYYALPGIIPLGFDDWFSWTPSWDCEGSMTFTSVSLRKAQFKVIGDMVYMLLDASGTTGGTASTGIQATLPINAGDNYTRQAIAIYASGSENTGYALIQSSDNKILFRKADTSNWGLGTGKYVFFNGAYNI